MKNRLLWFVVVVAAFGLAIVMSRREPRSRSLDKMAGAAPASSNASAPATAQTSPAKTNSEVAIEDRKTIDFSSGAPVVKDSAQEKAIIDRATKEMEDALKNVTFAPASPTGDEKKKAEPVKAPPNSP